VRAEASAEVEKMKNARDEAKERVSWLEGELMAVNGRVSLSEFRLREEVSRSMALIAEADELTAKLREAEDLLEVCYREYGVPRKCQQKTFVPSPVTAHSPDKQATAGGSTSYTRQPSREQQLLQQPPQQRPSMASTEASLGGPYSRGGSFSGNKLDSLGNEHLPESRSTDPAQSSSDNSPTRGVHSDEEVDTRSVPEVASLCLHNLNL